MERVATLDASHYKNIQSCKLRLGDSMDKCLLVDLVLQTAWQWKCLEPSTWTMRNMACTIEEIMDLEMDKHSMNQRLAGKGEKGIHVWTLSCHCSLDVQSCIVSQFVV